MSYSSEKSSRGIERVTEVQYLKGVGPARAELFVKLGIETAGDLLDYFPRDWVFVPEPVKIGEIQEGIEATVIGQVESTDFHVYRRPHRFEVTLADDSGIVKVIWFNAGYLQGKIHVGQILMVTGKPVVYKHILQLSNPRFIEVEQPYDDKSKSFSGGVYPATANLSSGQIKAVVKHVLPFADQLVDELFGKAFLKEKLLIDRGKAYQWIHLPADEEELGKAKRRLKYDELFLMQLGLAIRRYKQRHLSSAPQCTVNDKIDSRIRRRFPFLLTEDQNETIGEICKDMATSTPMNRLLQGDVGSGKTVVALYAALLAVANKQQVAIMAPTEILANQHFGSISRYLEGSSVKFACITGGLTGDGRQKLLTEIKCGRVDIVVGTVALLQADIEFERLGLVIIDEQHKFGVNQRAMLRKNGCSHCLVMTATPIPRTLAMTAFGDLDVSIIKHSPPGRGEVVTRLVDPKDREKAYEFIRQRLRAGRQAFFVYPRITSEENGDLRAATGEWEHLSKKVFPEFRIELLHGQMSSEQKQRVMGDFRSGKVNALVSTVVIEVGVDVPNATIMVIEEADRFGLAQLHQLRGRIGRGQAKSFCLLFSGSDNPVAHERLGVMTRSNDGFEIAEHDMRLRGPGELFSTRQHGLPDLKIADIIDDYELLVMARRDAFEFVGDDPALGKPQNKAIRMALKAKFGDAIDLSDIG